MGSDISSLICSLLMASKPQEAARETILPFLPQVAAKVPSREGILDHGQEGAAGGP